jgi:hypothetical protein
VIDLRRELEHDLDRFVAPDQWIEIDARVSAIETTPIPPKLARPRAPRLAAALVAFAVFVGTVVVLWTAFRPGAEPAATPPCATGTWEAPVPSNTALVIADVDASPAGDVWVLGFPEGSRRAALLHLDETGWSEIPPPGRQLRSISAVASDDLWILGQTQVWRSRGRGWSPTQLPITPSATATALGVIAADDAYAAVEDAGEVPTATILHWDGSSWKPTDVAEIVLSGAVITTIEGSGTDDVWAVGHRVGADGTAFPLALHWDGSAWTETAVPPIGPDAALVDVVTTGPTDAWARVTTAFLNGGSPDTHLLRWDGAAWSDERTQGGDERFSDVGTGPSGTWLFTSNRRRVLQHWTGSAWETTSRLTADERLTGTMLWHFTRLDAVRDGVVVVRMGPGGVTAFTYRCG